MSKKILIIEDEQTLVKALSESLVQKGYEIETAADGEEGLQKIKELKPDLVLLDLILPKMDGFAILQKLRSDDEIKDTKVMVLTNLSDVTEKVIDMGAIDCLVKSDASIDEIQGKIESKLA